MNMREVTALKNIVRIGIVSSVDASKKLVRVEFVDKQDVDGKPLVSGSLKILQNQPLITIEKWVDEAGEEWNSEAEYNSHERNFGLGESYVKQTYAERRGVIKSGKL